MNRSTKINLSVAALSAFFVAGQTLVLADEAIATKTYKAESTPNGAKVSKTTSSLQGNADGSVSATRAHESHAVSDAGTAHHTSNSSTTVKPDGSTASVKQEARTTTP